MKILSLAFLGLAACLDNSIPPDELASTEQHSDVCVPGGQNNDELWVSPWAGDDAFYTRTPPKDCANHWTQVAVHLGAAPIQGNCKSPNEISVTVADATWNLGADGFTNDKVECENSTLQLKVTDSHGHAVPLFPSSGIVHPSWVGNHCGVAFVDSDLPDNADVYKVRALAIRGLEANGHGYAKLTIKADHGDLICF